MLKRFLLLVLSWSLVSALPMYLSGDLQGSDVSYEALKSASGSERESAQDLEIITNIQLEERFCNIPADTTALPEKSAHIFQKALLHFPCHLLQSFRTLEILDDPDMPRALAGRSILKIRKDVLQKPEFESLLVHELSHIVDLGGLKGTPQSGKSEFMDGHVPIFQDDVSVLFYRISWKDSYTHKQGALPEDFVSGYARHDVFEDFSESLTLYVLHGHTFRSLAENNTILQKKYDFFREYVFEGKEFSTGSEFLSMDPRPWDVTKL